MKASNRIIFLTGFSFLVYFVLDELYFKKVRTLIDEVINFIGISQNLTYLLFGIPLILGTFLIHKGDGILDSLGLTGSISKALFFAMICTAPMFIGFACVFELSSSISFHRILITVIAAGFFEELYFRGFLFGQLFRYTWMGFILAVLPAALIFGLLHLYQGTGFGEVIGVFLITFAGGILFAWAYVEWNYNIWVPIFLHMLMNLAWELFSVSDNALGGVYSNVFRAVTIAMVIILTIKVTRGRKENLKVTKKNLFLQRS